MPPSNLPPIIFVRHGETDWNKKGFIQGSIDTDLNDKGRAQAQAVAQALLLKRDELTNWNFVVSPQKRARDTMGYITAALEKPPAVIDARVRELGFGVWENHPFWELKDSPIFPADAERRYVWRPEGGESYQDGVARVDDWLSEIKTPTLVVAHGAVGRCIMGRVAGLPPEQIVTLKTPQGCYCYLHDGRMEWVEVLS
jgi:broad specificity phosphatase PhoE